MISFPTYKLPLFDLNTLRAKAHIAASRYELPADLVCAVCEEESGNRDNPNGQETWNPWAIRYEQGFLNRYIHPAIPSAPTTTEIADAFSYGLMQIMGLTARELGFAGRFATALCVPEVGLEFGCRKLSRCMTNAKNDVAAALLAYNGGSDPAYPSRVIARQHKYLL